ncbi:MAG: regulatory protein RecX [Alistipes sp.]
MWSEKSVKPKERQDKTPEQALTSLMRLCARAEKSSGDALRLMRTWGVAESAREGVLQKLLDQRFIDDERYTAAFVREKTNLNGWGLYKIRAALQRKGIARHVIEAALSTTDPAASLERLLIQLQRKARTTKQATPYELKTKLIRYGLSLGYEYEMVVEAASSITKSTDENDLCF